MAANEYCQLIVDTLEGKTPPLRATPAERLDWSGPGALLDAYRKTSGANRSRFIEAIGQVIEDPTASPSVVAQLIQIAYSLDLAQVEPQVRLLEVRPEASTEPLKSAIANFVAFRALDAGLQDHIKTSPPTNGKPRARKTRVAVATAPAQKSVKR
jgi:hypothetical protein